MFSKPLSLLFFVDEDNGEEWGSGRGEVGVAPMPMPPKVKWSGMIIAGGGGGKPEKM